MDQRLYCDDEVNVRAYRKMGYVKSDESNRNKSFPKLVLKKKIRTNHIGCAAQVSIGA